MNDVSIDILSDVVIYLKYARFLPEKNRRETWDEIVTRNKNMHLKKYPQLKSEIEEAYTFVYAKKVLPSMRSLQFAGPAIERSPVRLFNCSFLPIDNLDAFSEIMFLLLSGVGTGYSVQFHHVESLPEIIKPTKTRRFLIGDSIEGWADAVKVLIEAYFYNKFLPVFDFSDIRSKGSALVTTGGRAPGPEPLKDCLHNIQKVLDRKENGEKLTSLECHDILCFIADAVLAGGIRRAAMLALFSLDDDEMLECKFGKWYELNPQRARANNSALVLRHKIDKEKFSSLWSKIKQSGSGEPGIAWSWDHFSYGYNPCLEASLKIHQFCNLTTINACSITDQKDFNDRSKAAAFIGTLQAGYTDFHYLRPIWKEQTEKDALLGVSITGIASSKVLDLNLTEAANIIKKENERVSKLIGTNKASRCTLVKPEGTASSVLGSSSGIHAWHSNFYIRRIRIGKNEPIYTYLNSFHKELVEDDFFRPKTQAIISIPIAAPEDAVTREESSISLLERVKKVYNEWILPGHRKGHNPHSVSCTVSVKPDEWEIVGDWMWNNRNCYAAISVLPYSEHSYIQEPFEEISKEKYNELILNLKKINLSEIKEDMDYTSLKQEPACSGKMCEVV